MPTPNIIVIALGTVYYLIVYLFIIRRGGRPILPWTVSVLAQVVSAAFYLPTARMAADYLAPLPKTVGYGVTAFVFILLNCIIIGVSFKGLVPKRQNYDYMDEMQDFELKPIETVPSSDFIKKVENATSSAVEEEYAKDDSINEKVLEEIDSLIAAGNIDEAVRYLKMVAYYGSNEELSNRAKEKLAELTASESVSAAEDEVEVQAEKDNAQE